MNARTAALAVNMAACSMNAQLLADVVWLMVRCHIYQSSIVGEHEYASVANPSDFQVVTIIQIGQWFKLLEFGLRIDAFGQ